MAVMKSCLSSLWFAILSFWILFLNSCGGAVGVPAETLKGYEELAQKAEHSSAVSMNWVAPPINHILLIRRGQEVCALMFTEVHHDESGLVAQYEWWSLKLKVLILNRQILSVEQGAHLTVGLLAVAILFSSLLEIHMCNAEYWSWNGVTQHSFCLFKR